MKRSIEAWICLLLVAMAVQAADRQWQGTIDGNWGTAGNWSTGVPVDGDRAFFTYATPGTTSVVLDEDCTLSRLASTSRDLLYFNSAHNYTIGGPGTLTFLGADANQQNMLSIGTGGAGTTQTIDANLVFNTTGNAHRVSTLADAHWVFNGNILAKQTFNVRLNDLNSSATFNGDVALTNGSVMQIYGGTIRLNSGISGTDGSGVVVMQAQGRDVLILLDNAAGPVFDSSLTRIGLGSAPSDTISTTIRLEVDNQIAANAWFRTALLDLNGHSNTNAGWIRLSTDGDVPQIDFGDPAAEALWFADSSAQAWASGTVLDLLGFEFGYDSLRFGTDANGLTAQQLGQIRIDGQVVDGLALDADGFLVLKSDIPELSSVSAAEDLKAHILAVRGLPLTDMEVKTVIRVSDYGAVPDDGVNDLPAITAAMNAAAEAEKPVLVLFEKGRYQAFKDISATEPVLDVRNTSDTIVDGQGAEMIVQSPFLHFSDVRDSQNIIIRNFEIDYDPLPFSQGTVVAVDPAAGAFEIEVDAGFPDPDEAFFSAAESWGMLKDPVVPGRLKPGSVSFYRRTDCVPVGGNRFRITLEVPSRISHFEVGDRYAQVARISRIGSFLRSDQVTFMNLAIYACPGAVFIGSSTSRLNVLNCDILLKDGRLLTTGGGGVILQSGRVGPWVEGCRFEGLSDDCTNFYSVPNHILDVVDSRTLGMSRTDRIVPGDRLAFFQPQSGRILAELLVESVNGSMVSFTEDLPEFNNLAPEGTPFDHREWKIYDHAYNLDATGNYFVIRNNTFRDGRRYGAFSKASYGLISGNHIEGLSHAGITVFNEPNWPEGFYSHNLVVAENTILDCALMDSAAMRISFQSLGASSAGSGNQANFYLYRNRVDNPHGPAMNISRMDGITFAANRISSGPAVSRAVILKDGRIRPDGESFAVADDFVLPDGIVTDPADVPSLLGPDWVSAAGTHWQILNQELVMGGSAHAANRTAATPNSGEGDWFIVSATLRLDTTDSGAWVGLAFNDDEGSGQFLAFRFNREGRVQLIRPDGSAEWDMVGFAHIQNRPYQLTAASFQPHAYYLEVKDSVTGEVLYSDTVANSQSSTKGLTNGIAGLFSGTGVAAFQDFRVWNSASEPSFTQRGVPLGWYAALGITPQSEGVSSWDELDEVDSTGQGVPNWRVYVGGTDPADPSAPFGIRSLEPDGTGRLRMEWNGGMHGAAGPYRVEYKERLGSVEPWLLLNVQERVDGVNAWTGSAPPPGEKGFFRVLAEPNRF